MGTTFVGIFTANDGVNGTELWRYNGAGAPVLLKDIYPGSGSSSPGGLTRVGATLFFQAQGSSPAELWKSDGTAATTAASKPGMVLTSRGIKKPRKASSSAMGPRMTPASAKSASMRRSSSNAL